MVIVHTRSQRIEIVSEDFDQVVFIQVSYDCIWMVFIPIFNFDQRVYSQTKALFGKTNFVVVAFLENTCALLWRPIKKIPEALMREQVCSSVPFSVLFSSPCSVSCRSFSFQCSQSRCISSMCGHRHRHIHILFPPSQTHHQLTFCNFYNVYRRKLGFSSDQDSMHKRTLHPDLPLHMRYTLACGVWCSHHLCLFSFLILILSFLQSEQITLPSGHGIAWSV